MASVILIYSKRRIIFQIRYTNTFQITKCSKKKYSIYLLFFYDQKGRREAVNIVCEGRRRIYDFSILGK